MTGSKINCQAMQKLPEMLKCQAKIFTARRLKKIPNLTDFALQSSS